MNMIMLALIMTLAISSTAFAAELSPELSPELRDKKVYDCRYHAQLPHGVAAWAGAKELRQQLGREARFVEYNSQAAQELANDATADRGVGRDTNVNPRQTAFYQAYNDRGWHIYIEASEPLIDDLLDAAIDPNPRAPARQEAYEVFFTPGLYRVPYYQIFTRLLTNVTDHYDWAMPSADYRSLKDFAIVESQPIEKGIGTFIFIPWEAVYESVPFEGSYWRFNIVRWMPFAKAGGVSWNGKVHDTGNFGLVRFHPPTAQQKQAIQNRLVRYGWFKFQASSQQLKTFWTDTEMGDPAFFTQVIEPAIAQASQWEGAKVPPKEWKDDAIQQAWPMLKRWMEFEHQASALRTEYLVDKRFADRH